MRTEQARRADGDLRIRSEQLRVEEIRRADDGLRVRGEQVRREDADKRIRTEQIHREQSAKRVRGEQLRVERLRRIDEDRRARTEQTQAPAAQHELPSLTSAEWLTRRGTREFITFGMRMLRGKFSDTPAVAKLWHEASLNQPQSDKGYNKARTKFWQLVASGTDDDAKLIRAVLQEAGYETPSGKAINVTLKWATDIDPARLAKLESKNPELAAKVRASARQARQGRKPENLQVQQRKESIEHVVPRHPKQGSPMAKKADQYPNRFLDPSNLRFENLYENMLMGNKPPKKESQ
jgi:hypothetical protein